MLFAHKQGDASAHARLRIRSRLCNVPDSDPCGCRSPALSIETNVFLDVRTSQIVYGSRTVKIYTHGRMCRAPSNCGHTKNGCSLWLDIGECQHLEELAQMTERPASVLMTVPCLILQSLTAQNALLAISMAPEDMYTVRKAAFSAVLGSCPLWTFFDRSAGP
jgi:hypothetical protein